VGVVRPFAAPPMIRSGPAAEEDAARVAAALKVEPAEMLAVEWADNGPGWVVGLFESAERVLELRPDRLDFDLGAVGFHPPGSEVALEVRAFAPVNGLAMEDPVTGSLQASVAQWLLGNGRLQAPYVASQGGAIGRSGRVEVDQDKQGTIWVGGRTETVVAGEVRL
jgi:PhzF family phenazine biosynthesis protein